MQNLRTWIKYYFLSSLPAAKCSWLHCDTKLANELIRSR